MPPTCFRILDLSQELLHYILDYLEDPNDAQNFPFGLSLTRDGLLCSGEGSGYAIFVDPALAAPVTQAMGVPVADENHAFEHMTICREQNVLLTTTRNGPWQ